MSARALTATIGCVRLPTPLLPAALLLTAGTLTSCAADLGAERAGAWLADQPHVAKVLDDAAIREGELSAMVDPHGAYLVAELEPGTVPADLDALVPRLKDYVEHSRLLEAVTVRLEGDDFAIELHSGSDADRRRVAVAQELVSLPGVAHVDLTSRSPADGRGPLVELGDGSTAELAAQVFAASAGLGDAPFPAEVTAPGQPTLRTDAARALPAATQRFLTRAAALPGVRRVVVGPTSTQMQSDWMPVPGRTEPVEVPGLPPQADLVALSWPTAAQALDRRTEAVRLLAASHAAAELTVAGGPLVVTGSEPLAGPAVDRLRRLAAHPDVRLVRWKAGHLDVEVLRGPQVAEVLGLLPDVAALRLTSTLSGRVDLRGDTQQVRRLAAVAQVTVVDAQALQVLADGEVLQLGLPSADPAAFAEVARAARAADIGSRRCVVSARVDDRSLVELRFRPGADGRATDVTWSLGNFPDGDPVVVERAGNALVAAWDSTA